MTDKCWWKGKLHSIFFSFCISNSAYFLRRFVLFSNGVKIVLSLSIEYSVDLFTFFRVFILCSRKKMCEVANGIKYMGHIFMCKKKLNTLRKPEGKTHEKHWCKKTAGSVLLHRKVCRFRCVLLFLCENLLSPYCLESVSQFFPRCVFLAEFFPLVGVVVVGDDECCCYCYCWWWCRSVTWMCAVETRVVDLCIGWLVFIFLPHSTPNPRFSQCYRDFGYRMQFWRCRMVVVWWCTLVVAALVSLIQNAVPNRFSVILSLFDSHPPWVAAAPSS